MDTTPDTDKKYAAQGGRITLATRLRAWWEGDLLSLRQGGDQGEALEEEVVEHDRREVEPITLRQEIWGQGYTRPSSREFFLELVKPLGLNSDTTLNLYGCDLARGACDAAAELGSYVARLRSRS